MTDSKNNPSPHDEDDDSQKWDLLAQLLGAKPPAAESWDRPRGVPSDPSEPPRKDKGTPHAQAKGAEPIERSEETDQSHWSSVAGNLGVAGGDSVRAATPVPTSAPPTARPPSTPPATPAFDTPMSPTMPAARKPNVPPAQPEYVSAWDFSEDTPSRREDKIVNPFANEPKPSLDPAASILSNLFGPSNSRLAGDPELENPSSTIRQVDDVEPIDEVRFEKFDAAYGDFGDLDQDSPPPPGAEGEEGGGERRGRRRGRGRGRGRDRDKERGPRSSDRAETPRRPARTQNRPEPERPVEFIADDDFDSFGPGDFEVHDVEPTTWSGATPIDDLEDFDDPIPEVPQPRSRRDENDDYEVAPERGRRIKHPKLPSWLETVGIIVDRNLSQRSQSSGGGSSGGGNFRRRRGPRRRPSR